MISIGRRSSSMICIRMHHAPQIGHGNLWKLNFAIPAVVQLMDSQNLCNIHGPVSNPLDHKSTTHKILLYIQHPCTHSYSVIRISNMSHNIIFLVIFALCVLTREYNYCPESNIILFLCYASTIIILKCAHIL